MFGPKSQRDTSASSCWVQMLIMWLRQWLLKWCYDLRAIEKKGCHFNKLVFSKSVMSIFVLCTFNLFWPYLVKSYDFRVYLGNLVMDSSVFYSIFVFFFLFLISLFILKHIPGHIFWNIWHWLSVFPSPSDLQQNPVTSNPPSSQKKKSLRRRVDFNSTSQFAASFVLLCVVTVKSYLFLILCRLLPDVSGGFVLCLFCEGAVRELHEEHNNPAGEALRHPQLPNRRHWRKLWDRWVDLLITGLILLCFLFSGLPFLLL